MGSLPLPSELGTLALFAGLADEDLLVLAGKIRSEIVASDVLVVSRDDPSAEACVVQSGMLKVYVDRPDGSDVVLAMLGPGEVVGELNLIDHLGRSANVVTIAPSRLLWLDEVAFRDCMRVMPRLTENLLSSLARRLRLANAQVQAMAGLSVQGRLAHQLLALADGYGSADGDGNLRLYPNLLHTDLAGMVGADPDHVLAILKMFQRQDYITVDQHHRYTITDRQSLARLCS